jgi:hypothetical protein
MTAVLRVLRLELDMLLDAISRLHSDHAIHGIPPSLHRAISVTREDD